jgi:DNA-binding NarL/FixJ family response regulator
MAQRHRSHAADQESAPGDLSLMMHPDAAYAVSAFKAGASGYVLKHSAPDELITTIREGIEGKNLFNTPDRRKTPAFLPIRIPLGGRLGPQPYFTAT